MKTLPLRRLVASVDNGAWGVDPEESSSDRTALCIRAADFAFSELRVDTERAPTRGFDTRTLNRLRLRSGDIVLEKSGGGDNLPVGRSVLFDHEITAVPTNFAARLRPAGGVDPKYLVYLLRHLYESGATARSIKQTTGIQNLDTDAWLATEAPYLPEDEQRRIADFLDDRVSRIDRIIAARREQMSLVRDEFKSLLESRLDSLPDRVRASRMMRVLPGYAFPSPQYSEDPDDVPLLRGVNVGVGTLRWDEIVRWPRDQLSEVAQFQLSRGDVVLGMDRPWIGEGLRIAQVQESDAKPLLLQRVAKLIPGDLLNPRFMIRAFQSQSFRTQIESVLTGLSVPHLSGDQILEYLMPYGAPVQQRLIAEELDEADTATTRSTQQLQRSTDLLTEYKSSLITAAVTGELDVSTAGSSIPG